MIFSYQEIERLSAKKRYFLRFSVKRQQHSEEKCCEGGGVRVEGQGKGWVRRLFSGTGSLVSPTRKKQMHS